MYNYKDRNDEKENLEREESEAGRKRNEAIGGWERKGREGEWRESEAGRGRIWSSIMPIFR